MKRPKRLRFALFVWLVLGALLMSAGSLHAGGGICYKALLLTARTTYEDFTVGCYYWTPESSERVHNFLSRTAEDVVARINDTVHFTKSRSVGIQVLFADLSPEELGGYGIQNCGQVGALMDQLGIPYHTMFVDPVGSAAAGGIYGEFIRAEWWDRGGQEDVYRNGITFSSDRVLNPERAFFAALGGGLDSQRVAPSEFGGFAPQVILLADVLAVLAYDSTAFTPQEAQTWAEHVLAFLLPAELSQYAGSLGFTPDELQALGYPDAEGLIELIRSLASLPYDVSVIRVTKSPAGFGYPETLQFEVYLDSQGDLMHLLDMDAAEAFIMDGFF